VARFVVAAFRADMTRAGVDVQSDPLVRELRERSPDFDALWQSQDVGTYGEGRSK
jgi:hypothetical protein